MAHVASDLKSLSLNRMLPQAGKASYAADRNQAAPFDSILDETTRPTPEPRQKRAADDKPRTERPERAEHADRPDRATQSDDTARPADITASADSAKDTTIDSKNGEPVPAEQAASEGETKTPETTEQAGETKPAEAATSEAVAVVIDPAIAAAAQVDTKQDTRPAAIAATAGAASAAEGTPNTAAEAGADAALADAFPNALAALAAKTGNADKAEKKAEDKPALAAKDSTKAAGKADATLHADTTHQTAAAGEPHKNSDAHGNAQDTANSHRGVASDTPAAAAPDTSALANTAAAPKLDLAPPPALMTAQAPAQAAQATAAVAASAPAQSNSTDAAVPVAGVAFEITSKVISGKNQFDIRLDPAELGRIHVRLDVDRDGNVVTHMIADRPDTLDMLRKDTAGLERALQDAGLKTSDNSLQFSLRDQQTNQQQSNNGGSNNARIVVEDEQAMTNEPAIRNYAAYRGQTGGLDIRV